MKKLRIISIQLALLFLLMFCLNACHQESSIHISPLGNDNNKGTANKPVASIERANLLVQEKMKQGEKDTIRVIFHEGTYRLNKGIVLDTDESGTEESPVIYQSKNGEKVIISGAIPITDFSSLSKDHFLYKKNPEIGTKIIEIDLTKTSLSTFNKIKLAGFDGSEKSGSYTLRELYFNGKSMPLSRWPNEGYVNYIRAVTDSSEAIARTGIVYNDEHISGWKQEPNILLHGYWTKLWDDAYEHVAKIDTTNQIIWLTPPYNKYYFSKNKPFAARNVISEIDEPGEWAYDDPNKKIYFYPPEDITKASLELSVCETPLLQINNASWITVKGIHFQNGAGNGMVINNSSHVNILDCEINGFARDGILMNDGQNNNIASCHIYDMGRGGIKVSGGNRETFERADFIIDNCHIHDLSRIDRTYTPGVVLSGVGSTLKHCKFHDIPSSAIRVGGNDHIIEYNEMFDVVTESDDQGAIDMYGDPTYRGNVFRYNYIHDTGPQGNHGVDAHVGRGGIRFDDAISGNFVYSNVFKNCSGGLLGAMQIHGGSDNLIWNNIFYQCHAGVSFTVMNQERWDRVTTRHIKAFEKNRFLYISRYPNLVNLSLEMENNAVIQNILIECDNTTLRMPELVTLEQNLVIDKNRKFPDLEANAYSIRDINVGADKIKFEPIPFEKIGLRNK
ncbi:right-handed parallel beta-helix repeat-containing protein [uncultured Draconibacterium sp.]|uniref:right-handed parallel beta-helix repeat-containing protein n=1 Tax=uncultured Draconibacterium sp. TaxID=1573823 RepID=UPI0029C73CDC|nr:right-handed parallel beta-helix repeat-containing protein [uncultured Draconibacterium sp.]